MSEIVLTEALLSNLAGWEAMKTARGFLAADRVVTSEWQAPELRGAVRQGESLLRAGLVIRSASDADNLCPCRDSRDRGLICAHSVAVGLHFLKPPAAPVAQKKQQPESPAKIQQPTKRLRRAPDGQPGEPLAVHWIFPPNLVESSARGRVMIYLEGARNNGRAPLASLPMDEAFQIAAEDQQALDLLESITIDTPSMAMLSTGQFLEVLARLAGNSRVTIGKSRPLEISGEPLPMSITATLCENGEIDLRLKGSLPSGIISGDTTWVLEENSLRPLVLPAGFADLLKGQLRISRADIPRFLNTDWPKLISNPNFESNFSPEDFTLVPATPRFSLHLAGGLAMLQARLQCFYGDKPVSLGVADSPDSIWMADAANVTKYSTRNFSAETQALSRFRSCGFSGPDSTGHFHLKNQDAILSFFAAEFPCMEKEWSVTLEERLESSTRKNIERIEPRLQVVSSGEQWFDFSVEYDSAAGEKFNPSDIRQLLLSGRNHTRLKNGKFALLDTGAVEELQEILLDCAPEQLAGKYRVDNSQAGFLNASLRQNGSWKINAPEAWSQRAAQQQGEVKLPPPELGALRDILRPYQVDGVAWLAFLRANGFGGILADEMGLGKTLQVLALLEWCRKTGVAEGPFLVVCPTSLVFNWAAEAAKFTPQLKTLAIHGAGRKPLFAKIAEHDLIVTSYALFRRDVEYYKDTAFDTAILDEAQHIKNRDTQNAQAVKTIRSKHRLVLTGTPLENSVLDLWSIFDFLMPGYLGKADDFRARYETPILREKSLPVQQRLARRLRPFLLRRLKRDVAADLPEKIEQVSYCDLNDDQRALYRQVMETGRREILEVDAKKSPGKFRMLALTTLLRLRQICCDIRLLKLGEQPGQTASRGAAPAASMSAKLDLFAELMEEILDGGHRVLVFSQFTQMLDLLEEELVTREIKFCRLDGSTRDRAKVVGDFQRESHIPAFLISLKAGGVGLNLTGADTVIHFDPWWNPAVEAQATDRAHRIGQKKIVTSYKLIARGTVEEKILNLQNRKKSLFQGLLGGDEEVIGSLSWDEIQDLLAE